MGGRVAARLKMSKTQGFVSRHVLDLNSCVRFGQRVAGAGHTCAGCLGASTKHQVGVVICIHESAWGGGGGGGYTPGGIEVVFWAELM